MISAENKDKYVIDSKINPSIKILYLLISETSLKNLNTIVKQYKQILKR